MLTIYLTEGRGTAGFPCFCNYHYDDTTSPYSKLTHTLCKPAEYPNVGGNRTTGSWIMKFIPKKNKTETGESKADQREKFDL